MRSALVVDINSAFGTYVAPALMASGWHVRTLVSQRMGAQEWMKEIERIPGNPSSGHDLVSAARDVDAIVLASPDYQARTPVELPAHLEPLIEIAEAQNTALVLHRNLHRSGDENTQQAGKSATPSSTLPSNRLDQRLRLSVAHGAQVIRITSGDFIGMHDPEHLIRSLLLPSREGYRFYHPGKAEDSHAWVHLPDLAYTVAHLLEHRQNLAPFGAYELPGYRISHRAFADAISTGSGRPVKLVPFELRPSRARRRFDSHAWALRDLCRHWGREVSSAETEGLSEVLGTDPPATPLIEALIAAGAIQCENQRSLHWTYVQKPRNAQDAQTVSA